MKNCLATNIAFIHKNIHKTKDKQVISSKLCLGMNVGRSSEFKRSAS